MQLIPSDLVWLVLLILADTAGYGAHCLIWRTVVPVVPVVSQ